MELTCSCCGLVTSKPGVIVEGRCASAAACKRRRDRRPQYRDWTSPSFEQQRRT